MPTKTLKLLGFQLDFFNVLRKIIRNCMSGLFCMENLLEAGGKKHFFNFMDFNLLQSKIKQNISN